MAEKVPGWLERLLLPQISELKGEVKAFRGQMEGELKSINTRIDALTTEIKDLRESMNMAQRLAVLEAQVKELRKGN